MKRFLTLALTCLPLLCFGATTYTTYFNNTHTYTNATVVGTNFAGRGVFTNGITAGASTFTGAVGFADGTDTVPSIGWTSDADGSGTGFWRHAANRIGVVLGNSTTDVLFFANGLGLKSAESFGWSAGVASTTLDTILVRDGAANTLALRNAANAQTFNVYNTYTDASNYERATIAWSGNILDVGNIALGTGTQRQMRLVGSSITIRPSGTSAWQFNTSGHLLALTDNTYDIGAAGATRPRHYYGGGNIIAGGSVTTASLTVGASGWLGWTSRGVLFAPSDGVFTLYDNANTSFNRLQFGGTTASFPALKRSSTEIQVRLADDSADAPLKSGQLSNTGIRVMTPSSLQTLAAANALLANATKVRVVGSGGAVTLTSTPTIADGSDGQYVMIQGTDDTNTLTVQDQGSLASSNLELGAATRVLGAGDVLVLTFDSTASVWYEVSFANN